MSKLEWINYRWHLDGRGIHAGTHLEMLCPDSHWLPVRIESENCGRQLYAHFCFHQLELCLRIFDDEGHQERGLRWFPR